MSSQGPSKDYDSTLNESMDSDHDAVTDMAEPVNVMGDEEYEEDEQEIENTEMAVDGDGGENMDNDEDENESRPWQTMESSDFQFELEGGQEQETSNPQDPAAESEEANLAGLWCSGTGKLTAKINSDRRFVCVDYPGVVKNVDKALATMEGLPAISKTLCDNGKLSVFFRPEDPFCKPVHASCTFTQNLLVKVRRRKKIKKDGGGEGKEASNFDAEDAQSKEVEDNDPYEYQLVVEGIVDRMYFYDGMCDFQYLPMARDYKAETSTSSKEPCYKEILSDIIPQFDDDRLEYLSRPIPLFLPPLAFGRTRRGVTFKWYFDDDQVTEKKVDIIETERKKRSLGTIHVTFDHRGVPTEPNPEGLESSEFLPKTFREAAIVELKRLFEIRPIWSKIGLKLNIDPTFNRSLARLLPSVAYYIINGAWKNLWCRFGYDPRTNPEAKMYQTIDFRIRKGPSLDPDKFEHKRNLETKGMIRVPGSQQPDHDEESSHVQYVQNLNATYAAQQSGIKAREFQYIYRSGQMPAYRQMRYQICDIHNEKVQQKLHENDGKETVCTERDGWCVPDFTDICRDILHTEVENLTASVLPKNKKS